MHKNKLNEKYSIHVCGNLGFIRAHMWLDIVPQTENGGGSEKEGLEGCTPPFYPPPLLKMQEKGRKERNIRKEQREGKREEGGREKEVN